MPLLHDSYGLERDVCFQLAALTEPRGAGIVEAINEAYPSGVSENQPSPISDRPPKELDRRMNNNCTMSLTTSPDGRTLDTELPEDREYEDATDAELDEALVQAIRRAEDAEKEFLTKLLHKELKSHYYETRLES